MADDSPVDDATRLKRIAKEAEQEQRWQYSLWERLHRAQAGIATANVADPDRSSNPPDSMDDPLDKQFKLECLGDGEMFVEATCQKCRSKLTIELNRESIRERLEEHAAKCGTMSKSATTS